ncbi:phosphoribosylaminoimidazolecarboxamide formyltransferase [Kitasatospora cineracea]|uniref:Phosphoribosylaminoimidazolecarboxamide formyltransferase/IMP cyclohydrolase n=1 Tax=Kitasatospora cineracea TaxID=88074 RepID=A0A3N4RZ14_9ACTN|nr:phosphoribosylaminoimidazolecarboxamide formyltransferase [Kitasatospora cineracea]RPE36199.1 phosphoribosylaminoimidazolecarboxamide formyltransferase/IMP cyclohydrolase [Kitasatospora cineracea]
MDLRYGINPQNTRARIEPLPGTDLPLRLLNGQPSYVNLLDALNAWQLVSEAAALFGRHAAASFKHVSPAGAALAGPVDRATAEPYGLDPAAVGPLTSAYLRARDADPKSSYGDLVAVSHEVDLELADLLARVVSDGIVAPGYAPGVLDVLARKKNGRYLVLEAHPGCTPPAVETREVHGVRLVQDVDTAPLTAALLADVRVGALTPAAADDLLLGLAVLRRTQSNSVCYLRDGAALGIGAGQQSRVDCTRLAGAKTDTWWLRRHPAVRALDFRPEVRRQDRINWRIRYLEGDLTPDERTRFAAALRDGDVPDELGPDERARWAAELDGVAFVSDGCLPFRDNVDHARRHGVTAIAEPGGSLRSAEVEAACAEHGITLVHTGLRLFHH